MKFTTELPTEPGFYVAKNDKDHLSMVEVYSDSAGGLGVIFNGGPVKDSSDTFFLGSFSWCRLVPEDEAKEQFKAGMTRAVEIVTETLVEQCDIDVLNSSIMKERDSLK